MEVYSILPSLFANAIPKNNFTCLVRDEEMQDVWYTTCKGNWYLEKNQLIQKWRHSPIVK